MTFSRVVLPSYAATWLVLALLATPATAAPEIWNVNIRGLQIDATTPLTINGTDLLPDPQIVMSLPIKGQTIRPNATTTRVVIDVTLGKAVQPGMYNLWLANANGISGRMVVAVDHVEQQALVRFARFKQFPAFATFAHEGDGLYSQPSLRVGTGMTTPAVAFHNRPEVAAKTELLPGGPVDCGQFVGRVDRRRKRRHGCDAGIHQRVLRPRFALTSMLNRATARTGPVDAR